LNRSATYDPSRWTITSIVSDDALILPYRANPAGWNFRESQQSTKISLAIACVLLAVLIAIVYWRQT
jgi:hypothetical protein